MIIDVMLPDMQGTEIVQELARIPGCRFTKCIFLTGILSKKVNELSYYFEVESKKYRALPKPVRKGKLLRFLADAVQASLEEKENDRKKESLAEKLAKDVPSEAIASKEEPSHSENIESCST